MTSAGNSAASPRCPRLSFWTRKAALSRNMLASGIPPFTKPKFVRFSACPSWQKSKPLRTRAKFFFAHADRATELPGVDLSKLTPEQKKIALHRFNADTCTCGCKFTLAQCRIWDSGCAVSKAATEKIIAKVSAAPSVPSDSTQPTPAAPAAKTPFRLAAESFLAVVFPRKAPAPPQLKKQKDSGCGIPY